MSCICGFQNSTQHVRKQKVHCLSACRVHTQCCYRPVRWCQRTHVIHRRVQVLLLSSGIATQTHTQTHRRTHTQTQRPRTHEHPQERNSTLHSRRVAAHPLKVFPSCCLAIRSVELLSTFFARSSHVSSRSISGRLCVSLFVL